MILLLWLLWFLEVSLLFHHTLTDWYLMFIEHKTRYVIWNELFYYIILYITYFKVGKSMKQTPTLYVINNKTIISRFIDRPSTTGRRPTTKANDCYCFWGEWPRQKHPTGLTKRFVLLLISPQTYLVSDFRRAAAAGRLSVIIGPSSWAFVGGCWGCPQDCRISWSRGRWSRRIDFALGWSSTCNMWQG